ncbi:MAG: MFS transporter [Chloroflexi bacterium]|nr:MFS transporter [Chloroflexota bacterium]
MNSHHLHPEQASRFYYGYVIVGAASGIQLLSWGMWATFPIFMEPMIAEFGWTRGATSAAFSLYLVVLALAGVVVGRLADKFNPRVIITVCGLAFGVGYLLTSQVSAIWQLYLFYGMLLGIGNSDWLPNLSAVTRWFVKKRGLMVGIATSAWGLSVLVMPAPAAWLISAYGWRNSFIIIGIVTMVLVIAAAQLIRRDPGEMGLSPYGADEIDKESLSRQYGGLSFQETLRTRQLWIFNAISLLFNIAYAAYAIHIVIYATGLGISLASAAAILVVTGAVSFPGGVIMATTGDKIGYRSALTITCVLLLAASLWLRLAGELWTFYVFAVIFGFAYGAWFALMPLVPAELFGLKAHGSIMGFTGFASTMGQAAGPVMAGYIFDMTGGYQLSFLISSIVTTVSLALSLLLRPVRHGESSSVMASAQKENSD